MGDKTAIEWTDHTFNPWIGCQKVSPGCDNCYAEKLVRRYGWTTWGAHGERKRTSTAYWRKPFAWNRLAQQARKPSRVFCASLADVFDNQAPADVRNDLFELIRGTPWLHWQLLTKRPQLIARYLPRDWWGYQNGYPNVWLGITAENQIEYNRRWSYLQTTPASVRFVSYEPALGPINLTGYFHFHRVPDWVIWGGESGPGARQMEPSWAASITAECERLNVAVFGKQWGHYRSNPLVQCDDLTVSEAARLDPKTHGKGGALLNGRLYRQIPDPRP